MTLDDAHTLHEILSLLAAAYQNRDTTTKQKSDDGSPMFTPQNIAIDRLARAIRAAEERGRQLGLLEAAVIATQHRWGDDAAEAIRQKASEI